MAQTADQEEEESDVGGRRRADQQGRQERRRQYRGTGLRRRFTNDYHRRPATAAKAGPAFFELLGVVETRRLYTWAQADTAVQVEALTRLREYHATLDADHQRLWKEWLDKQLVMAADDKTGRKDFLTRLSTFVT